MLEEFQEQIPKQASISLPTPALLSQFEELKNVWDEQQTARAEGGLLALSGFEHQFLLTLLQLVRKWKDASEADRENPDVIQTVLTEAISDIAESGLVVTLTQVKRTLSKSAIAKALEELWEIFNLASLHTPDLLQYLHFVVSGKFEDSFEDDYSKTIDGWGTKKYKNQSQLLKIFKSHVSWEIVSNPKEDLTAELEALGRDEDSKTIISRWLGYLIQLGSGLSPEAASSLVWRELTHDASLKAFQTTLARIFSRSRYRLRAIRYAIADRFKLSRTSELSQLKDSISSNRITLLRGSSGSGKSALCKIGIQEKFQDYTCLFLHPDDVAIFEDDPKAVLSKDLRRFDELLAARIIDDVIVFIDDVDEANDQSLDSLLNLLQNTIAGDTPANVRFVFVTHLDTEQYIQEQIATRFDRQPSVGMVELPQLPFEEISSIDNLPKSVTELIKRSEQFGSALNFKLLDWLVRKAQTEEVDTSNFQTDLDLLNWFWRNQVGNGRESSEVHRILIKISQLLADRFTPDVAIYDSEIDSKSLISLARRDCLRVAEERISLTHRFVGDCARFHYLLSKRRELETENLAEMQSNILWSQPMRWFALYLAIESDETEIWQEFLQESIESEHNLLIKLLIDGAILSGRVKILLNNFSEEQFPFLLEKLCSRLLTIATLPHLEHIEIIKSLSPGARIVFLEKNPGTPRAHLWIPAWQWILSLEMKTIASKNRLVFKMSEAWLNWRESARSLPYRSAIAKFTLNLAKFILFPDINREERWSLGDSSVTYICIIICSTHLPEDTTWLLKALAGLELTSRTQLQAKKKHPMFRDIIGTLEYSHPKGAKGKVNNDFREFMLSMNGLFLDCIVRSNPELGAKLFLALTIKPPRYRFPINERSSIFNDDLGTVGSSDLDVCTFKFLPLQSLLNLNEELGIEVVSTLCQVANNCWQKNRWEKDETEGMPKTDINQVELLINGSRKCFRGGRHSLYWHRQYSWSPNILACFLMTLEGWLYERPDNESLKHSIELIFDRADTVAILGVLVSLAKKETHLLTSSLLPLISSLQLLIWYEFEEIDGVKHHGFDDFRAYSKLSSEDYQELYEFHLLAHRKTPLSTIVIDLLSNGLLESTIINPILRDWDDYQLNLIPECNYHRALSFRQGLDPSNWKEYKNEQGTSSFRFTGTLSEDPQVDAEAKAAKYGLLQMSFVVKCRQILDGKLPIKEIPGDELVNFFTNEKELNKLKENLSLSKFYDTTWAALALALEFYPDTENEDLDKIYKVVTKTILDFPISLNYHERCQLNDLDASAFIANAAPKLLLMDENINSKFDAIFRCLIGIRDKNTSIFMASLIKECELSSSIFQKIIQVIPLIARLISLTRSLSDAQCDDEINRAWNILEQQFVEDLLPEIHISDIFSWTPDNLEPFYKELPKYLKNNINWGFATAAYAPVINAESSNKNSQDIIIEARENILSALLYERARLYKHCKYLREEKDREYDYGNKTIYPVQETLISVLIGSSTQIMSFRIDRIFSQINKLNLRDFILVDNIIYKLRIGVLNIDAIETDIDKHLKDIAFTIGDFLSRHRNSNDSELNILGDIGRTWEESIELLTRVFQIKVEDNNRVDYLLTEFFNHFDISILHYHSSRRKILIIGSTSNYKSFRKTLFKKLSKDLTILDKLWSGEGELLVKTLANLWESERSWFFGKQSRLNDLRKILECLQSKDVEGATTLYENIANSLTNKPR